MTLEPQHTGPSREELASWVLSSGESDFVDAKGPMTWDGADASASLAKDIVAFANSRDGGVIVIGKSEAGDGGFAYDGLSPAQLVSFDTTKVGQWVNSRFAPPVRLACHQADHDGRKFVVIVVQEFEDIPSLCVKSFQETSNSKNHLLREGTIYVRNQNAESKPIKTVDELRAVIGLATRKKGNELIEHFRAMLKGRSLTDLGPAPDPFGNEIDQLRSDLKLDQTKAGWWMTFRPAQHSGNLWSTPEELERLISKYSVRIYNEFPASQQGTFSMVWGIANDLYGETWALTKSGMFCVWKEFRENQETADRTGYRPRSQEAERPIPPGDWVEYTWSMRTMLDFFLFQSRFIEAFGPGQDIPLSFNVGPLAGRKLVALNRDIVLGYGAPEPCRAPYFLFDRTIAANILRTSWEQTCAESLKQLLELFPNHWINQEVIVTWIEKYKNRKL